MKKIKKIKIKLNGKIKLVNKNLSVQNLVNEFKIPIKKVAIELNEEILNKKMLKKIRLKKNDKIFDFSLIFSFKELVSLLIEILFFETFILVSLSVYSNSVRLNSVK